MKHEKQNSKNEFSINKINRIISKINKTGLILIIACYVGILSFALSMIGTDISYIPEPNYEHVLYDKEISPQITLVGVREFDEDHGHAHTKYSISVSIAGRHIDEKDPKYKISSFSMSATTKTNLTDTAPSGKHFFTEHTQYNTPITHTYTMDSSDKNINPATFYIRLQYEKENVTKISTFKENVFLAPTADDIDRMNDWYNANIEKSPSAANIKFADDSNPVGVFEVQNYMEYEDGKATGIYKGGVRISINEDVKDNFHVDMQSWIVTESGEYLPFIGVYNYTGPSKKFTNSLKDINEKLNPEFIVAKIVYRDQTNQKEYISYFKQDIQKIKGTFSTNQEVGVDSGAPVKNLRGLYIGLTIVSAFALGVAIVGGCYIYLKQSEKKNLKK